MSDSTASGPPSLPDMVQQPLPLAFVNGKALVEKPIDLYIPPDALEVILETFSGPLDLLLYLIRKQKVEIVDLPVFDITKQYMEYVDVMIDMKLELAADYMLMAAMLAEIKSRLLLPKLEIVDEEDDPRAELIRRLKEYEIIKDAALQLDAIPRLERDMFHAKAVAAPNIAAQPLLPEVSLQALVLAFQKAVARSAVLTHHHIEREQLSTRERMSRILNMLRKCDFMPLNALFTAEEGRSGCVVSFLAVLELVKEGMLECVQVKAYSDVHVRLARQE
ncbi:MAG: ScpA family protein [Glaciecola sp.]|nr:ScpA family protein [Glaciecola sp.]